MSRPIIQVNKQAAEPDRAIDISGFGAEVSGASTLAMRVRNVNSVDPAVWSNITVTSTTDSSATVETVLVEGSQLAALAVGWYWAVLLVDGQSVPDDPAGWPLVHVYTAGSTT